ncbi:MAG: hypothetical protein GXO04_00080 [Aquificae bacterium]|nr:hypothetical protein [Aquificota bacterium]
MKSRSILLFIFPAFAFSAVPPEVKADYTPPKAKTGYGNTLFESANKYCMHCHYDLHETWKNSMHANSWKDPIFQKLYQSFLKYLVSEKLGLQGETGTFTTDTFKNVGKICLGCHAPGALYSQDFKLEIREVESAGEERNTFSSFDPALETILYATNKLSGKTYEIVYHIGHENNREGINCALCHSVEEIKMSHPGDTYTLSNPIKIGPIGPILYPAGYTLHFDDEKERNAYFSIVGPEFYSDYADTRNSQKTKDGRFRIKPIPIDGEGGTFYAGGPYYGPFGVTALDNVADDDQTDRRQIAQSANFNVPDNHFNTFSKTLCLSCHQRSAKRIDSNPANVKGLFMELCTTLNAIDPSPYPTEHTPKCTTCHMEYRTGILINKWKQRGVSWELSQIPTEGIRDFMVRGIFSSHRFEGASSPDKVRSGVEVKITSLSVEGTKVKVEYYVKNKTAHMFPGAHPMRRVFTILRVFDQNGNPLPLSEAYGITKFEDVVYTYDSPSFAQPIRVEIKKRNEPVTFLGKIEDINGEVCSQWIDYDPQTQTGSKLIVDKCDGELYSFTRVYGRELINTKTASLAPGFAADTSRDNRLVPNEVEYYTVYFNLPQNYEGSIIAKLGVYYHKTGATGILPLDDTGFVDMNKVKELSLPVYELYALETQTYVSSGTGDGGGCNSASVSYLYVLLVLLALGVRRFL